MRSCATCDRLDLRSIEIGVCRICYDDGVHVVHPCGCKGTIGSICVSCLLEQGSREGGRPCRVCNKAVDYSVLTVDVLHHSVLAKCREPDYEPMSYVSRECVLHCAAVVENWVLFDRMIRTVFYTTSAYELIYKYDRHELFDDISKDPKYVFYGACVFGRLYQARSSLREAVHLHYEIRCTVRCALDVARRNGHIEVVDWLEREMSRVRVLVFDGYATVIGKNVLVLEDGFAQVVEFGRKRRVVASGRYVFSDGGEIILSHVNRPRSLTEAEVFIKEFSRIKV
jgi:hypothetical protein